MRKEFTGYHITAILVAFFGLIIAVNLVMAHAATRTFGGLLAKNGYVASRDYNRWIAASEAQDQLGWTLESTVAEGHLVLRLKGVSNPRVRVAAEHPLGGTPPHAIEMALLSDGHYRSVGLIPAGRWKVRITVSQGNHGARYLREVRI